MPDLDLNLTSLSASYRASPSSSTRRTSSGPKLRRAQLAPAAASDRLVRGWRRSCGREKSRLPLPRQEPRGSRQHKRSMLLVPWRRVCASRTSLRLHPHTPIRGRRAPPPASVVVLQGAPVIQEWVEDVLGWAGQHADSPLVSFDRGSLKLAEVRAPAPSMASTLPTSGILEHRRRRVDAGCPCSVTGRQPGAALAGAAHAALLRRPTV